ncbi:MAG: hypothetical protein AAFV33_16370 [Chloroflexota bacterium]
MNQTDAGEPIWKAQIDWTVIGARVLAALTVAALFVAITIQADRSFRLTGIVLAVAIVIGIAAHVTTLLRHHHDLALFERGFTLDGQMYGWSEIARWEGRLSEVRTDSGTPLPFRRTGHYAFYLSDGTQFRLGIVQKGGWDAIQLILERTIPKKIQPYLLKIYTGEQVRFDNGFSLSQSGFHWKGNAARWLDVESVDLGDASTVYIHLRGTDDPLAVSVVGLPMPEIFKDTVRLTHEKFAQPPVPQPGRS